MATDDTKYRLIEHISDVDISEQDIREYDEDVLRTLLIAHTMSAKTRKEAKDQPRFVYSDGTIADTEYVEWLSDLKLSRDCGHSAATI